jgi:DNA mismatch repair protein MutS
MLSAACGLIAYLDHVGRGKLPLLLPPVARVGEAHLAMDEATRASLEILLRAGWPQGQSGRGGGPLRHRRGRAPAGRRPLRAADRCGVIEARLDLVGWLVEDALLREDLRRILRALPDVGRALGRVVAGRGSPRDLGQLRDGLSGAAQLAEHLGGRPSARCWPRLCCRNWWAMARWSICSPAR